MAINTNVKKEILGVYISEVEVANFWLHVLTDLHNRGIKDILIAYTDKLKGFSEIIQCIYPKNEVQSCVVYPIHNSLRHVAGKDKNNFMVDLEKIYKADSNDLAELILLELEEK